MWVETPWPGWPLGLMLVTWAALVAAAGAIRSWRDAVLIGSVGWGVIVWAATEAQSLGGFLNVRGVVFTWIGLAAAALVLAAGAWWFARRTRRTPPLGWSPAADQSRREWLPWLAVVGTLGILGATATAAWFSPPNTWDALAYHVPRVMYWVQYGSVDFFPTANDRHLFMSPWPAYDQLQAYLLWGSDRVANFVQWTCFALSVVAATAVAGALGAGRKTQALAAAITVAVPMAVVSSAATQSDHTAAVWLLVFAAFAFRRLGKEPEPWLDVFAAGGAIGLACLSKGTAFVIGGPLVLAYVGFRLAKMHDHRLGRLGRIAATGFVAALLLTPHTTRMMVHFGHPTTPEFHQDFVMNASYRPAYIASNLVRGVLTHLGTWDTRHAEPILAFNTWFHESLGIEDGDDNNSHRGQPLRLWTTHRKIESSTGNALHVLLYFIAGLGLLVGRRTCRTPRLVVFAGCLLLGYVLFCMQIKYQWWISRLQLPLFLLAAPWAAAVLERWWGRWGVNAVALGLIAAAVPFAIDAERRPLIGPDTILAADYDRIGSMAQGSQTPAYEELARRMAEDSDDVVGFVSDGDNTELRLWMALRQRFHPMPRIENLVPDDVDTPPMAVPNPWSDPPRLLVSCEQRLPVRFTLLGEPYRRVYRSGTVMIYQREDTLRR